MLAWIKAWYERAVAYFRPPPVEATPPAPPAPPPVEATPPPAEAEATVIEQVSANRHERRRLERLRVKRDVLVKPKLDHIEHGPPPPPKPEPKPRVPRKKKVIEIVDDPDDVIIADELVHGDGKGDVLFEKQEFMGEFNFRDSILDQLERYWFYLRRMRTKSRRMDAKSRDMFDLYSQVGAVLVPHSATGINGEHMLPGELTEDGMRKYKSEIKLSKWFKDNRPSWGCIAWGTTPLVEKREKEHKVIIPRFMYFIKYSKAPPEVQPMPGKGDVYMLTIWWDSPTNFKKNTYARYGTPNDVPIFVSEDGEQITALKCIETRRVRVGKRGNNFDYRLIPKREWNIPKAYEIWAASHHLTADLHLPHLFCMLMHEYELSQQAMARVSVTKGDITATFGINPRRLAYFFRDRDIVVTVNGQKKRIMHYVSAHVRHDGTEVKDHFRGAREFKWANYDVYITIPGRDHMPLHRFNVGPVDAFWWKKGEKMIDQKEIGRALVKIVHGAPVDVLAGETHAGAEQ